MKGGAFINETWHDVAMCEGGWTRRYSTYEWKGDKRALVFVHNDKVGGLPWPVRLVEEDYLYDAGLYVRTDVPFWWITEARHKLTNAWRWFFYRLVATGHVWGFARWEVNTIPTWRCFFARRRS